MWSQNIIFFTMGPQSTLGYFSSKTRHDVSSRERPMCAPNQNGALNIIYHSPHGKPQKLSALSRGVFIVGDVIALWLENIYRKSGVISTTWRVFLMENPDGAFYI
jgi:hypothetical protein